MIAANGVFVARLVGVQKPDRVIVAHARGRNPGPPTFPMGGQMVPSTPIGRGSTAGAGPGPTLNHPSS